MSLSKLNENLNVHQSQPDQPSLTGDELKMLWDSAPNAIKNYINDVLTVELDKLLSSKVSKVVGMDLSKNSFTDDDKSKLAGIDVGANNYIHPVSSGSMHVPPGGVSGQILRWGADGTAVWGADNNTTYSDATQARSGLMSAFDKKKIDQIAAGATRNIIRSGTGNPSGGASGDVYIQYF